MSWNNLVSTANRAQAKACIHGNIYLDQRCFKGKRLLKISIHSRNNRAEKLKAIALSAKANPLKSDQLENLENVKNDWIKK